MINENIKMNKNIAIPIFLQEKHIEGASLEYPDDISHS